jgi:hypothetical protein
MGRFYKLESNKYIPIIYKFCEKNAFTQYPINMDGILNIKHYYHIPFYIVEASDDIYFYIDNTDILHQIVTAIKRNIINEDIIKNEHTVKKVSMELGEFEKNNINGSNDDEFISIEKRLYHANENLRNIKRMQLSSIFIETELPDNLNHFFMV